MSFKELLQKRRLLKSKKPKFATQDAHKKTKLQWRWRRPRGSDSRMRVSASGYRRPVEKGWGSPAEVKGLDRSGLMPVVVSNTKDLATIDPKKNIIVIAGTVGQKKRMEIVTVAQEKKMPIANCKDPAKFLAEAKEAIDAKKKAKEEMKKTREQKKEAAKKEAEKKKAKEEKDKKDAEKTEEEKKEEEKKEKDKALISTQ
jgi:large subunit ribosomal protein L32e